MALPKIAAPTFELTQPSTGKKLQYRPFLVKEEKILLMARESGDKSDIYRAIKQIINNCVNEEGFDVDEIPLTDMEYIFIQLRSKSIDNMIKFQIRDEDDGETYEIEVDLDEVEIQFPKEKHDGIIQIDETHGVKMKHPSASISDSLSELETINDVMNQMVFDCIECVFDKEKTYLWEKETREEKLKFIDSLPVDAYSRIEEFFETAPYIEHIATYKNKKGEEKKIAFRTLNDFFTLD